MGDGIYQGEKSNPYTSVICTSFCDVITGTLFIPISYACDRDPWEIGYTAKTNFERTYSKNVEPMPAP